MFPDSSVALTLVHAVEYLVQLLFCELVVVLLPALPRLTAQDHQLPLLPPERSKVGDLHDYRPTAWSRRREQKSEGETGNTAVFVLSGLSQLVTV